MVQFADGAVKAQLGMPDMRVPIQFAFSYPRRLPLSVERIDFTRFHELTSSNPTHAASAIWHSPYEALHRGGNMPCIVNAANEVVVEAFLHDRISFLGMSDVIARTMERVSFVGRPTYDDYVATDARHAAWRKSWWHPEEHRH